jgi:hypothetical protein
MSVGNADMSSFSVDKAISPTVANRIDYIKKRFGLGAMPLNGAPILSAKSQTAGI